MNGKLSDQMPQNVVSDLGLHCLTKPVTQGEDDRQGDENQNISWYTTTPL